MNKKILNTIANAIDNREEVKRRIENGKILLQELHNCIQNVQNRFGGKSELATEDDIRISQLCEKWEKVLSHGIRTNLSNSSLQSLVTAGLNFTFNIITVGNSLWSYSCLHLTKHEKERFQILSNINTPVGYFRAFLRAALNERSLHRYLQSWIAHGLILEYYDEGALVRDMEIANTLPSLAAGLSSVLFALSIDRESLNESQQARPATRPEHVIPLPAPVAVKSSNARRKPLRQVISFDKHEQKQQGSLTTTKELDPTEECVCKSAPATCLNSPEPSALARACGGEPASSEYKSAFRHFFPDTVRGMDSPSQILTKLSERAKEIFSSSNSIDLNNVTKDDVSELSVNNMKISESDSEEVAGSIEGGSSCLELCFTEEGGERGDEPDDPPTLLQQECIHLHFKCTQIEIAAKEKVHKLENIILDLSKENDRLKEQLRHYMSAVEMGKALRDSSEDVENEEVSQYEKKLVQVAQMHAELMEFNQHLLRKLQELECASGLHVVELPESNVKVYIPSAFLVGKKTHSYHVYQIFLKIGSEEWNVYHRYAKFYELHTQLKKLHPDIASYKFPPKITIRKREARVVEHRRLALQAYLRHVVVVLPELRACTTRAQLILLLPFFGSSSTAKENGFNNGLERQISNDSNSTYNDL